MFVTALSWRFAYLARLSQASLAESLGADAAIYWEWAGFLRAHGPWGERPFFLGPLYPYVLSLLRVASNDSVGGVLIAQMIWGSLAIVLLADAARRVTTPAAGVAVGVVLCFYEMAVFFDGLVLAESLLFFLEALSLWLVSRTDWAVAPRRVFVLLGGCIGLLAEGRAIAAVLLVPAAWALVPRRPAGWTRSLMPLLFGFAIVTAPFATRNVVVSRAWIPFTYNAGFNLYVGNNPEAQGAYTPITGSTIGSPHTSEDGGGEIDGRDHLRVAEGLDLSPRASSSYWTRRAMEHVRSDPFHVRALALRKLGMFWNRAEYPQVENAREYRGLAGPLGLPWIGRFAFLGVLAVAGLWYAPRSGPAARFALGYVLAMSLAVVPFFVTDRYRLHLVPGIAILAAIAIAKLIETLRQPTVKSSMTLAGTLLAGAIVVHLPAPRLERHAASWLSSRSRGERFLTEGRLEEALREFERTVAIDRDSAVDLGGPTATRSARAHLHFRYGSALHRSSRHQEAVLWLERASQEAPAHAFIARALGDAYQAVGRTEDADSLYARLDSLPGGAGLALASHGWQAARAGKLPEAEQLFLAALEQAPHFPEAWGALIRVQAQLGRTPEAAVSVRRAKTAGLPPPSLHAHKALVHALEGKTEAAAAELRKLRSKDLGDHTVAEVVRITQGLMAEGR